MHEAVAAHPKYHELASTISGRPEARVLQAIAERYFELHVTAGLDQPSGLSVLVEDQSTNCGANAAKTRQVLEQHGIKSPRSIIVSQDPTMCRRTIASFEQVYADTEQAPALYSWPTFVPAVTGAAEPEMAETPATPNVAAMVSYDAAAMGGVPESGLWEMRRFLDLLLGEIPRLRDDGAGYGPKGKGFITHVDVPARVEEAWLVLDAASHGERAR
jgi:hypothetical protein